MPGPILIAFRRVSLAPRHRHAIVPNSFSRTDALANIEQYAIDLAWDIIARFADAEVDGERLPVEFFLDWAKVAEDEAKHYSLLDKRLHVSSYARVLRPVVAVRSSGSDLRHAIHVAVDLHASRVKQPS